VFRLPGNLAVARSCQGHGEVVALEGSIPPASRVLVGVVLAEGYQGFYEDCERADGELRKVPGLSPWPEYDRFVTPDPDGEPIAWVSYCSSPAFWAVILGILGATFIIPILGAFSFWVVEKISPGFTQLLSLVGVMMVVLPLMLFLRPKET